MRENLSIIFLVILVASELDAAWLQSSSSSSISISTTNQVIRLRANRMRRPDSCRENLNPKKADELPVLVITGRIKEVYLTAENGQQLTVNVLDANTLSSLSNANSQRALVNIERIFKGNQDLLNTDIIVSGFNGTNANPCPNFIKPNDTWIMLLDLESDRKYSINGSNLLSPSLNNFDRLNAIISNESYKRRSQIDDILCEAHYCPYGRCVANDRGQLSCHCPETCGPLPSPVCGSDNTTYTNECYLIKEGCRRQRPLFVTKELPC